jgi:small subunit ribosomal protein S16
MALVIRLRQQGRKNRPFFRLVVTDVRARRDGKYHEALGWYDPIKKDNVDNMSVKADRVQHWLDCGAQMSENVRNLLARETPEIVQKMQQKEMAHLAKEATKRKQRNKS